MAAKTKSELVFGKVTSVSGPINSSWGDELIYAVNVGHLTDTAGESVSMGHDSETGEPIVEVTTWPSNGYRNDNYWQVVEFLYAARLEPGDSVMVTRSANNKSFYLKVPDGFKDVLTEEGFYLNEEGEFSTQIAAEALSNLSLDEAKELFGEKSGGGGRNSPALPRKDRSDRPTTPTTGPTTPTTGPTTRPTTRYNEYRPMAATEVAALVARMEDGATLYSVALSQAQRLAETHGMGDEQAIQAMAATIFINATRDHVSAGRPHIFSTWDQHPAYKDMISAIQKASPNDWETRLENAIAWARKQDLPHPGEDAEDGEVTPEEAAAIMAALR